MARLIRPSPSYRGIIEKETVAEVVILDIKTRKPDNAGTGGVRRNSDQSGCEDLELAISTATA